MGKSSLETGRIAGGFFTGHRSLQLAARIRLPTAVYTMSTYIVRWWLGSRVVSVLDSGAERPGFKSQSAVATLSGNSLRQTVHNHCE